MTEHDPPLGSLPMPDHDHDVLLIAGSRPEVARLAPVATAFADAARIRALTVASGPDPMAVHEAFEALGVPADITQLLREPPSPHPAAIAAALMTRLDELLVDLDPSAVLVYGGGMTGLVAAQVAFWRQIPVVHLQAEAASDDLLCPFPQEANRRVIGHLASLLLTTGGPPWAAGAVRTRSRSATRWRATRSRRTCASPGWSVASGAGGPRLVLVGLDRADSLGVLAGLPDLLEQEPDIEVVIFGELAAHGAGYPLLQHKRATMVRTMPLAELVGLIAASSRARLRRPRAGQRRARPRHAGRAGRRAERPDPGDSIRSILSPAVMTTVRQVLAAAPVPVRTVRRPGGGARRAGRGVDVRAVPVTAARPRRPVQHRGLTGRQ